MEKVLHDNGNSCEDEVDYDLEDGEIFDEEYDTEMAESTERNTELKASKENCLGEGAKQKIFEHSWDMEQRPQQSSHQQMIHAPLHNKFSGFNNNKSRDRIPRNKKVITKRSLSYQINDDRGKRRRVDQNNEDNERRNRCKFMQSELTCKYYYTGMKCYSGVNYRFSHAKLDREQKKNIFKNNLEKKPPLSMQTYDQPFLDDPSDDDEFNGLVIDEENFQNDVKDQLLSEKQKELLNNNGNSCENEVDEDLKDGEIFDEKYYTEMVKSTVQNTEPKESKENCLGEDTKEKKLKYHMLPCEVSVRDYSDIPPTMGIDDPRLRHIITAAKDPMSIQNSPIRAPLLQTTNPLQPFSVDIDMRHMPPPIMTCQQMMAVLNDSRRKSIVPRDPRLQRHRFDVDQRLNNINYFII